MKKLRVGLAGLGVVGGGLVQLLRDKPELPIELVAASARHAEKCPGGVRFVADARDLAVQPDVDVVVEVIGGADGIAHELVRSALNAGRSVVTANKALLAVHGNDLFALAARKEVSLSYEAAVCAGLPVIRGIRDGLAGNQIFSINGILNGTCNFILTEMTATGREFADVLKEAQSLGYAEPDPSFDVDGIDTAHKLSLLSALAFGGPINFNAVKISGIREVTPGMIDAARSQGMVMKLLAHAEIAEDGTITQVVASMAVPEHSLLGQVNEANNLVQVEADAAGMVTWSGPGAGGLPTASGILADLLALAKADLKPVANTFIQI